ncbi:MAG: hypothetical protein COY40_05340 [Alphaproteobacteria bacterium CG_4_10_14_0_8_um_filter_53_9]|nr:MAG: hypothetical protein COY40_05340 [Alphaproteobacteria bacterium CG_4_10_14_0_8_um_filter_53_9]
MSDTATTIAPVAATGAPASLTTPERPDLASAYETLADARTALDSAKAAISQGEQKLADEKLKALTWLLRPFEAAPNLWLARVPFLGRAAKTGNSLMSLTSSMQHSLMYRLGEGLLYALQEQFPTERERDTSPYLLTDIPSLCFHMQDMFRAQQEFPSLLRWVDSIPWQKMEMTARSAFVVSWDTDSGPKGLRVVGIEGTALAYRSAHDGWVTSEPLANTEVQAQTAMAWVAHGQQAVGATPMTFGHDDR